MSRKSRVGGPVVERPAGLTLRGISKRFGSTLAVDNVSLDVSSGEVHALLGENGAGKSTLMQIAYGLIRPDTGTVAVYSRLATRDSRPFDGASPGFASPRAARAAGIGMVHQHFTSIPALTVAENIALAAGWTETGYRATRRADQVARGLNLPLPVSEFAEALSVQLRQRLEIVKALATEARILLLDEPTAVLAPREVAELLDFIRNFARRGGAVVLITHKLDEVFQVADRVTVLRRGQVTLSDVIDRQAPPDLARAMIGADTINAPAGRARVGEVVVRATGLRLRRHGAGGDRAAIVDANFEVRGGEIVGVAAIEGNGQRELLRAIAGVDHIGIDAGSLRVNGPVAFIPEDRTTEGLIPAFSLAENVLLGSIAHSRRWLDWSAIRAQAAGLLVAYEIRAGGPDVPAATLSGGNQQKLVLARALAGAPQVIVAEDPTRGLDVRATQAMHQRLRDAARNGAAVIVHASDLDEVLTLANRVIVVARGRLRELPPDPSRELVGDAMLAVKSGA